MAMIVSFGEIIDIIIMTFVVGYIFIDVAKQFNISRVPIYGFDWKSFKFACFATAPALILHELFHKFVAIAFGLNAVFHASYFWLGFGAVLKFLNSPFLFFVPAYVSIGCALPCKVSLVDSAVVAFAGPFANLLLFVISRELLKSSRLKFRRRALLYVTKQINLFLFVFNMLPFPLFDGFKVYEGLFFVVRMLF